MIEDRVAKEQARRKAEQELEELKAATKVSSEKTVLLFRVHRAVKASKHPR